ncbi:MAG: AAA family ATPase [Lentisphaeria bacterium]|nr:AAA family ATPase [Candidatus Neomarinimicrobiota bacterium]MCF7841643.1 AAA family ATPase [Lentisphaeria bacterium]
MKPGDQTFTIGIGGATGAGKSSLATQLMKQLDLPIYHLCTDRYLRDFTNLPKTTTGLPEMDQPESFHLNELAGHIRQLQRGEVTYLPIYDHHTHQRSPMSEGVNAPKVLIVEGIMALVDSALRDLYHLKIAVETDARIRMIRRVQTDVNERELFLDQIKRRLVESVIPAEEAWVLPANQFADIRVTGSQSFAPIIEELRDHLTAFFGQATVPE